MYRRAVGVAGAIVLLQLTAPASGAAQAGGAKAPERALVKATTCAELASWTCRRGETLTVVADNAEFVTRVVFLGRRGRGDDVAAAVRSVRDGEALTVRVPSTARTGPLRLVTPGAASATTRALRLVSAATTPSRVASRSMVAGGREVMAFPYRVSAPSTIEAVNVDSGETVRRFAVAAGGGTVRWDGTARRAAVPAGRYVLRVATTAAAASAPGASSVVEVRDAIFPIRAKHDLGQGPENDFGGARRHGGQDMFARCGAPLVAVRRTTVQFVGTDARAGNYVVLQDATGQSYVYMHMEAPAVVDKGDALRAGDRVGAVGDSGRASGCHLHFEMWTAPGWYTGGKAVDPLPELRRWAAFD